MQRTTKRWLAISVVLIAFFAAFGGAIIVQDMGNSIASSSGLHGNVTLAQEYGYVDAYNGTWHTVSVTSDASGAITFTVPYNTSLVYVFTDNSAYNVKGLLKNITSFVTASVSIAKPTATTGSANLSSFVAAMGGIHNSTSTSSIGDHAITDVSSSLVLYNSSHSINDMGKGEQFSIFDMMSGNLKNSMQLKMDLNGWTKNTNTSDADQGATITVASTQQYAVKTNIISDTEYVMLVLFIIGLVASVLAIPRVRGLGQFRIRKDEAYGLVAAVIVFAISYGILDIMGATYSFLGIGLPYEALFGFAMAMYFYGTVESVGRFDAGMGYGIIGLIAVAVVSEFVPFLNPMANFSTYSMVGAITAFVFILAMIVLAGAGIVSVKNSRLD